MLKPLSYLQLIILVPTFLFGDEVGYEYKATGYVKDINTNEPVSGVVINFSVQYMEYSGQNQPWPEQSIEATSNSIGYYDAHFDIAGEYTWVVKKIFISNYPENVTIIPGSNADYNRFYYNPDVVPDPPHPNWTSTDWYVWDDYASGPIPGSPGYGITINYPSSGANFTSSNGTISIPVSATTEDAQYQDDIEWTVIEHPSLWIFDGANGVGTLNNIGVFNDYSFFGIITLRAWFFDGVNTYFDEVWVTTFFDKCGDLINLSADPNWYYYWKQTSANTGVHYYNGPLCDDDTWGYYLWGTWQSHFYVCPRASGTNNFTGDEGIDCYAETCKHEETHVENWFDWWSGGYNSSNDWDRDYVPNNVEEADSELDPNDPYSNSLGVPDAEYFAYMAEYDWSDGSADSQDWANPGSNVNTSDEGDPCFETGGGGLPKKIMF